MPENTEPSGAQRMFGDFAPALVSYTDDVWNALGLTETRFVGLVSK